MMMKCDSVMPWCYYASEQHHLLVCKGTANNIKYHTTRVLILMALYLILKNEVGSLIFEVVIFWSIPRFPNAFSAQNCWRNVENQKQSCPFNTSDTSDKKTLGKVPLNMNQTERVCIAGTGG